MKLLLDENLSFRLCRKLEGVFSEVGHVRQFGLLHASDFDIWEYGRRNGYTLVTQDSDFVDRAILVGPPPKVIRIQLGNASSEQIAELLRGAAATIEDFHADSESAYLTLPLITGH